MRIQEENNVCWSRLALPVACVGIASLLLVRDGLLISIGRLPFLFIACAALLFLNAEDTRLFLIFLLPLYPGLPGNYLTLLFAVKWIFLAFYEKERFRLSVWTAVFSFLFTAYLWMQNLILGDMSVYHFALGAEILLLVLFISDKTSVSLRRAVPVYSASVLISGTAALLVFAGEHSLGDIFSGAVRFGDVYGADGMHMTLDPNFLGFSCLAGIAAHAELLRCAAQVRMSFRKEMAASLIWMLTLLFFGTIGLSRSFLLCIAGLAVLELLALVKAPHLFGKAVLFLSLLCAALLGLSAWLVPELLLSLGARFDPDELVGANGRVMLIRRWYTAFTESIWSLLFGTGLFRTNVHVTALQYLFGLGIVGMLFLFPAFIGIARGLGFRFCRRGCIPAVVTAVMSCSVPAACSLSALFPFLFALMVSGCLSGEKPFSAGATVKRNSDGFALLSS